MPTMTTRTTTTTATFRRPFLLNGAETLRLRETTKL